MGLAQVSPKSSGIIPRVRFALLDGGSAGDHTLAGITEGEDLLLSLWVVNLTLSEAGPNTTLAWSPVDLLSEFSISADDTINNDGGTDTSNDMLFIVWYDADFGFDSDEGFKD